jgi:dihydroorotate dehydrogenase electron transfer subunit
MIKDPQARIIHKECWKDYYLLSLESSIIASEAHPGQFVMVRIGTSPHPLLRRPFSIHWKNEERIEIFFQRIGLGTSLLSQKETNETLDIIGPLGRGFTISEKVQGKEIAAIGGGRGIAPLYFLAHVLRTRGASVKIFYGGKTLEDLPLRARIEKSGYDLFCSTDDGSFGYRGLVSDFFAHEIKKLNPSFLFSCGPEPMMEKIAHIAQKHQIPAEFSLESIMGCGFGACWGCVRRMKRKDGNVWLKVCEEGPVFPADEIIWKSERE